MGLFERTKNAWNAFRYKETKEYNETNIGSAIYGGGPTHYAHRYSKGSIIDTVVNRIAIDVAEIQFRHIIMDSDPTTEITVNDGLNRCLTLEANIDQSHYDFIQDIVFSMFDEGVVAVVPVDTNTNPLGTNSYEILTMRTGKIVTWYPRAVLVRCYDEARGQYDDVMVPKDKCAIIENPLYSVVNAENATFKRLIRKLQLIDTVDEKNASNKLDLILQMPYSTKSEIRKNHAEDRIADIERQLAESKYGIAYIDQTEKITQLGRSLENHLLDEIKYLTEQLFNQLGLTTKIFDGTADEQELKSYYDRTINPIAERICAEFRRKFLTDTARTRGHDIVFYANPFKIVSITNVASSSDSLRRNEILTTNEIRKLIGFQPADDPKADQLFNPNMPTDQDTGVDGGGSQDNNVDYTALFNQLNQEQLGELMVYIKDLTGKDPQENPDVLDSLSDEEFAQIAQKAQELIRQNGSDEQNAEAE